MLLSPTNLSLPCASPQEERLQATQQPYIHQSENPFVQDQSALKIGELDRFIHSDHFQFVILHFLTGLKHIRDCV